METNKRNLLKYGINPSKGRKYENTAYVLALIYNILQERVEEYLKPFGLSPAQFNMLMLTSYQNQGKGISQVEMAKHLIVSASNITKLVEKSFRSGLISRKINPLSRRENIICITPKGQKLINTVWNDYDKLVRTLTEKIPSKDRTKTETTLNNWLISLQKEK